MADAPDAVSALIAKADSLRDRRLFKAAAEGYRSALVLAPGRGDLWVQLGNMQKDDGDYAGAEHAYTRALELAPNNADTYLQLGRARKLEGRRDDAFQAFAMALELLPGSRGAIQEVVSLGKSWNIERQSGLGLTLALSVTQSLETLKASIARIEQDLPLLRSLCSVPDEQYEVYGGVYRVSSLQFHSFNFVY